MTLTKEELERYKRHTILPMIGLEGQEKLKNASVLIIGTGGLGSPIAIYLAASGVGTLGIVDFDVVDESNLQRQIIHKSKNVGLSKTESARETLEDINPYLKLNIYNEALSSDNALDIIGKYDLVCDGTDNFQTRYLINDACVLSKKINVFGSIRQFEGQISVFGTADGPCYRCLFPEPPAPGTVPSCADAGVMGVLPGVVGTIQATEIIKLICGIGKALIGRLLNYDALEMSFNEIKFAKDPECPVCGDEPAINKLIDYDAFCGSTSPILDEDIEADTLAKQLNSKNPPLLLDVREPEELADGIIEPSIHIPMNDVPRYLNKIPKNRALVVYCHSGIRSKYVVEFLKKQDYHQISNLSGGIEAWEAFINKV